MRFFKFNLPTLTLSLFYSVCVVLGFSLSKTDTISFDFFLFVAITFFAAIFYVALLFLWFFLDRCPIPKASKKASANTKARGVSNSKRALNSAHLTPSDTNLKQTSNAVRHPKQLSSRHYNKYAHKNLPFSSVQKMGGSSGGGGIVKEPLPFQ